MVENIYIYIISWNLYNVHELRKRELPYGCYAKAMLCSELGYLFLGVVPHLRDNTIMSRKWLEYKYDNHCKFILT